MIPLAQRIANHTAPEPNTGCLLWTGELNSMGYGRIEIHGKKRLAHRVAYEVLCGPIPHGMQVCHRCDVRSCVAPSHLFLGTQRDNMRDALGKGRHRAPYGCENGKAKLSPDSVADIRSMRDSGSTLRAIGAALKVSAFCVWSVLSGRTWKSHV